ncbi:ATP-binding protein [Pseudoduganella sp. OTU4001]|uniref:ATP-binding protein n=1 Tax=Pseudoduganella sp. OTU4001 TaxID=3043854 RepID=UPI00313D8D28
MRSNKVASIALLASVALTAIVTAVLLVFAAYSHNSERDKRWRELERVLNMSADQLAIGVALPAWNFDDNQVQSIMRASMNQRDLHAIVIYGTGAKREYVVQRGSGDKLEVGTPLRTTPDMLVAQRPIMAEGANIGTIKVFATPTHVQQELRDQRRANMFAILVLAAMLVASVYGLLWFLILRPLSAIGQYVAGDTPQKAWFFGELHALNESIKKMWALLDSRYRAMRESEERLTVATRAARIGIWDWDVPNDELVQDDEILRQYGMATRHGSGNYKAWLDRVVPEDRDLARAEVAAALKGEHEFFLQHRVRRDDGAIRHLRSMARSFRDEQGKVVRLVGVSIDVTDATESEQELRRHRSHLEELVAERTAALSVAVTEAQAANRAKSVFLSTMSHELRTPLNSVIGFSRLMAHSASMSADEKRNMAIIHRSGQHLLTLINDILELSKIEAGGVSLHREANDVAQLMRDVCDMVSARAEQGGIALKSECDALPRALLLDGAKLRQVLLNLASNALKFVRSGSVTLSLRATLLPGGRYGLAFAVRDTGIGIAPEEQQRIFEPFVQARNDGVSEGTGLGLAISRQYVRIMGGELEVQSEPGVGSTFRFTIEAEEVDAAQDVAPLARLPHLAPAHQARRILVVDDGVDGRHLLRSLLVPAGFDVYEASDGVEALDAIAREQPELVLMDWRMPVLDGLEATRRLRADRSLPQPRVVMLTASAFEEERQQALAAGADDFLRKPVEQDKLFRVLAQQLDVEYADTVLAAPAPAADAEAASAALTPAALATLPSALRSELHGALRELNPAHIEQVLAACRSSAPELAKQIQRMVVRHEYRQLCRMLEEAEGALP